MGNNIKNIIIVHHNADNDGIMSGVIAYNMYKEEVQNNFVKLYGYGYETTHQFMSEVSPDGVTNKMFQFIDVTPPIEWLELIKDELEAGTISVQIFDHHQLKYEDIAKLKLANLEYHFDNDWCGAYIYLRHWKQILNGNLLNNKNVSRMFDAKIHKYVEMVDCYDTWKFVRLSDVSKLDEVLSFHEFFDLHNTVISFNEVLMYQDYSTIIERGKTIVEYEKSKIIPKQVFGAYLLPLSSPADMPMIVIPGSSSYLSQKVFNIAFPHRVMVFVYFNINLNEATVTLSFRSNIPGTIDCARLARFYCPTGGGHKEAAGCKLSLDEFMEHFFQKRFDNSSNYKQDSSPIYGEYCSIAKGLKYLQENYQ